MDKQDVETTIETLNFLQVAFAVSSISLAVSSVCAGALKLALIKKTNAS